MCHLVIDTPTGATSKASSTIPSRRGQILGIGSHPSWQRWDRVEAIIPEAGLHGLDAELRSMSQGLASFTARHDHVAELERKKLADDVIKQAALAA